MRMKTVSAPPGPEPEPLPTEVAVFGGSELATAWGVRGGGVRVLFFARGVGRFRFGFGLHLFSFFGGGGVPVRVWVWLGVERS